MLFCRQIRKQRAECEAAPIAQPRSRTAARTRQAQSERSEIVTAPAFDQSGIGEPVDYADSTGMSQTDDLAQPLH